MWLGKRVSGTNEAAFAHITIHKRWLYPSRKRQHSHLGTSSLLARASEKQATQLSSRPISNIHTAHVTTAEKTETGFHSAIFQTRVVQLVRY